MADKPNAEWKGHPLVHPDDGQELHLASAINEFEGGIPRDQADEKALSEYRMKHHAQAAAHHLHGIKMAQAIGDKETAEKHGAFYELHCKALGCNPHGPVPEIVQQYQSVEDGKSPMKFKAHKVDQFVTEPVQKSEEEQKQAPKKENLILGAIGLAWILAARKKNQQK